MRFVFELFEYLMILTMLILAAVAALQGDSAEASVYLALAIFIRVGQLDSLR